MLVNSIQGMYKSSEKLGKNCTELLYLFYLPVTESNELGGA